jgi:hypothetical protein
MKRRVPSHRVWVLAAIFVCVSACDACNEEDAPSATLVDAGGRAGFDGSVAGSGGRAGVSGGGSGGTSGSGTGGFSGFAGFAGGFTVPPGASGSGACFDCGNGCFDCGMGCQCAFDPTKIPSWMPPFSSIGTQGWKDSTMPFCGGVMETFAMDVWADSTGVYAGVMDADAGVATTSVATPSGGPFGPMGFPGMGEPNLRTVVWHNDGSGWGLRLEGVGGAFNFGITGVDRGPLILHSNPQSIEEFACRLGMTTRGGFKCLDVDAIQDVVVVNDSLAYALMGGTRVLVYDGQDWHSHATPLPYPAQRLWADESNLIAVGSAGTLLRFQNDRWTLEDVGVLEKLTAIWGFAPNDLWIGTGTGKLLHFDGTTWTQRAEVRGQTCDTRQPVTGLWGANGVLFAHTPTALVRWKADELTTLGNWTCGFGTTQQVRALWGRHENEVFIGLVDQSFGSPCGTAFVAYYDGAEFHRM